MKIIVLLTLATFAAATPKAKEQWTSFKREHGKSYNNIEEEYLRMNIFTQNLEMIEQHNAKFDAGLVPYSLAMNHFGDMLPEEVTQLGFNSTGLMKKQPSFTFLPPANVELPKSIDWRQSGAVTPVKNQGHCQSCWAFSTTGAIEAQVFRKSGNLVSLSEQQLVDCSKHYKNLGCYGGLMHYSFNYLKDVEGLEKEDSYPYEGIGSGIKWVKAHDDDALKAAVATVGPISISVSAGNPHFIFYDRGVFNGDTCKPRLDHGMLLVGYGSEDGEDYWLVKNSWGPRWGEKGYMKLTMAKKNICGISSMASFPILE